ncbi:MAG TPA: protein translocase subunit SecD [Streptosporangiaceae bacterium]|nr:protein translocase subunit SecD [Streptosporangiaceae bacterium]
MAPPSTPNSWPGRYLTALLVLIVVMLAGVLGGHLFSPGKWHKSFVVGRGLDLSSGTSVTLQAQTNKPGQTPSKEAMTKAVQIITNRVNATGLNGASVVQQGNNQIVVSVPGAGAQKVATLVGETALLRLRQVLFVAPNSTTPTTTPTPTPSASSTGSGKSASPSPSPSGSASATPNASSAPSASASASPAKPPALSTIANGSGNATALTPATVRLFDKLNCADKNWKTRLYGPVPSAWDNPNIQTVSCFGGNKYALDKAVVQGNDLSGVQAQDQTTGWVVVFNVKNPAAGNLGTLTTTMYNQYYRSSDPNKQVLNLLGVVLDGDLQGSPPQVTSPISTQGQITGGTGNGFSQGQATQLADVLKYGSLPLSFKNLNTSSVSASLGSDQLSAGLFAALIGLLLVVIYSFIYYRGLGIVSVLSLAIAAMLTYLAVVLLSKYEGFTLSLAGIAGLIVAIGITADSFIVYFERLRDEVREGRSLRAAVERGWARARRTILVSDTVSFLAALLLYILSIGDVRGFAFTLGMTTLIDVIVVFLFTKPMITLLARTKFYGQGHPLSGLDPARLGGRAPWRGSRRPAPSAGGVSAGPASAGGAASVSRTSTSTREA